MTRSAEMMKGWLVFAAGIGAVPLTLVFEAVSGFHTPGMFVAGELFRGNSGGLANIVPGVAILCFLFRSDLWGMFPRDQALARGNGISR
jgi:hypothetical protein